MVNFAMQALGEIGGIAGKALGLGAKAALIGTNNVALDYATKGLDSLTKSIGFLEGVDWSIITPIGSLKYYEQVNQAIGDTNTKLGISANLATILGDETKESLASLASFGAEYNDGIEAYSNLLADFGKNIIVDSNSLTELVKLNKAFGEDFSKTFTTTKLLGKSLTSTYKFINQSTIKANKLGVNASKVVKTINDNIGLLNSYNFRNGTKGLQKMALLAAKTKISIDSITGLADNLFDLDDVVEFSSQMQMLGGAAADLFSDPFQVAFEVRNDPAALMKRVSKLSEDIVSIGANGELQVSALNRRVLKQIQDISGGAIKAEEIIENGQIEFTKNLIRNQASLRGYGNVADETLSKLANVASIKGGELQFNFGTDASGVFKDIDFVFNNLDSNIQKLNASASVPTNSGDAILSMLQTNVAAGEKIVRNLNVITQMVADDDMYKRIEGVGSLMIEQTNNMINGVEGISTSFVETLKTITDNGTEELMESRLGGLFKAIESGSMQAVPDFFEGMLGYVEKGSNVLHDLDTKGVDWIKSLTGEDGLMSKIDSLVTKMDNTFTMLAGLVDSISSAMSVMNTLNSYGVSLTPSLPSLKPIMNMLSENNNLSDVKENDTIKVKIDNLSEDAKNTLDDQSDNIDTQKKLEEINKKSEVLNNNDNNNSHSSINNFSNDNIETRKIEGSIDINLKADNELTLSANDLRGMGKDIQEFILDALTSGEDFRRPKNMRKLDLTKY